MLYDDHEILKQLSHIMIVIHMTEKQNHTTSHDEHIFILKQQRVHKFIVYVCMNSLLIVMNSVQFDLITHELHINQVLLKQSFHMKQSQKSFIMKVQMISIINSLTELQSFLNVVEIVQSQCSVSFIIIV